MNPRTERVKLTRSIVLQQPWASALVDGAFPLLARTRGTIIRGWVGVLAPKLADTRAPTADDEPPLPALAIVGGAYISDCYQVEGNVRAAISDISGEEFAAFYPEHFLPTPGGPAYLWILKSVGKSARPKRVPDRPRRLWASDGGTLTLREITSFKREPVSQGRQGRSTARGSS